MKIGAQLFTVREHTKTLSDLGETLRRIADIGYTSVQVSGTCPYTPEELSPLLHQAGLTCDLTHYSTDRILTDTRAVIDEHRRFGCTAVGIGSMPGLWGENVDMASVVRSFTEKLTPAARIMAEEGMHLMYHNHDKEYLHSFEGKSIMDYLSETYSPRELGFTLDLYWVERGGRDPLSEIRRLSGRLFCVHLKDMEAQTLHFAPVGQGTQNYPAMLSALEDAGTAYAFVEQDQCYGKDPFVCLKESFDYLHALGVC